MPGAAYGAAPGSQGPSAVPHAPTVAASRAPPARVWGLSKCPVNLPVHTLGLGMIGYSLFLSYKVYQNIPHKATGGAAVKMPVAFDFLGRPSVYVHPCVGAAIYPTLVLLMSGAECGYGMFKEATANAKKTSLTECPVTGCSRIAVELLFGLSIVTVFAQTLATRIVLDRKTPEEVDLHNKTKWTDGKRPYALPWWQVAGPIALAFLPAAAAAVCKAIHKK